MTRKMARLGTILVQKGLISPNQLENGLEEHQKTGNSLGLSLINLGFIKEEMLYGVLAEQLNIPYLKINGDIIDFSIFERFPARLACRYKLMPIKFDNNTLTVAATDPLDVILLDDLRLMLGFEVKAVMAKESDILDGIRKYYGIGADAIEGIADEKENLEDAAFTNLKTENISDIREDPAIIRFVNQLLMHAVKGRATDIHIEPYEDELRVRYRVDGVLYDIPVPQVIKHFQSAVISRIKIMANLDIAEKRLPHDGRIKIRIGAEELDLRISILPAQFGESVDIRLLRSEMLYSLGNLGLLPADLEVLETLIHRPHGIIFVTGPTGSGKTTTLYSCLSRINSKEKKIITIEDPIEYRLKGMTQIQTHSRIGLGFAEGLRSVLRHDPDIIMVGEVRDLETLQTTIRVALTGHLVFSTLHTNDASGSVARLLDMGVEPYLIASSVEAFIAQRLVRIICPNCRVEKKADKDVLDSFGIRDMDEITVYEGKGCELCKFSGYKGRTGIYEFLVMHEEVRELALRRLSSEKIKKKALELGMRTLRADGWEKIKKGITTVSEVMRVT